MRWMDFFLLSFVFLAEEEGKKENFTLHSDRGVNDVNTSFEYNVFCINSSLYTKKRFKR